MKYNWQLPDWPNFQFDIKALESKLLKYVEFVGALRTEIENSKKDDLTEVVISIMVTEAQKTSEIEGEIYSRKDVMSSIKNQLGLNPQKEVVKDKNVKGITNLILEIRKSFLDKLSVESLYLWHKTLMQKSVKVNSGVWRSHSEPMQIVSGTIGKEKVHFEAPPSSNVPAEMKAFIKWFNQSNVGEINEILHAPVRAAIAHVYFESIHPFEDGNGRIGRAISEKILSQHAGFYIPLTLSKIIESEKKKYYQQLNQASFSNNITEWIAYFLDIILEAQVYSKALFTFTLQKTNFFDKHGHKLNKRQLKVIKRMLEEGKDGFSGGINARKYMSLTKISKATATRDLQDLIRKDILISSGGGGRSVSYQVNL